MSNFESQRPITKTTLKTSSGQHPSASSFGDPLKSNKTDLEVKELQEQVIKLQKRVTDLEENLKILLSERFQPQIKLDDISNLLEQLRALRGA